MTPKRETWRTYCLRDAKMRNIQRPRGHQPWAVHYNSDIGCFRVGFRGEVQWERRMVW